MHNKNRSPQNIAEQSTILPNIHNDFLSVTSANGDKADNDEQHTSSSDDDEVIINLKKRVSHHTVTASGSATNMISGDKEMISDNSPIQTGAEPEEELAGNGGNHKRLVQ